MTYRPAILQGETILNSATPIPENKRILLDHLAGRLAQIKGIEAVVLGGSYARGTARDTSDLDIGLYYHEEAPFAIADVRAIAESVSMQGKPVVTDFYGWGPWVNGGAWIHTAAGKVDFLYRNLGQVERTIQEARQGILRHDYMQQPSNGFYSVIYLAETQICVTLYDPAGHVARLKRLVEPYPPALKERIVNDMLWSADFSLLHARDFAVAGDVYNTVGCLTRIAAAMTQALFALNERYFISDKKALDEIAKFECVPLRYTDQLRGILAYPGATSEELVYTVAALASLWQVVTVLPGVAYHSPFE
ncbi:MAG TPA: nucleotidyltransferase domain-containing protein [Anaerolineae bacterium]